MQIYTKTYKYKSTPCLCSYPYPRTLTDDDDVVHVQGLNVQVLCLDHRGFLQVVVDDYLQSVYVHINAHIHMHIYTN